MKNIIDGRPMTVEAITRMGNCRLVTTQKILNQLLMAVEAEIEARSGQGGGGLI